MTARDRSSVQDRIAQRQIRIGQLAAAGHTPRHIATQLGVAVRTVTGDLAAMGFTVPYVSERQQLADGSFRVRRRAVTTVPVGLGVA